MVCIYMTDTKYSIVFKLLNYFMQIGVQWKMFTEYYLIMYCHDKGPTKSIIKQIIETF